MVRLLVLAGLFPLLSTVACAQWVSTGTPCTASGATACVTTSGTQTLTNKTISGSNNTFTNIPLSAFNLLPGPVPSPPSTGFLFFCDQSDNNKLKVISSSGNITTLAIQ